MSIVPDIKVPLPDTTVVFPHIANTLLIQWLHFGVFEKGFSNTNNNHKIYELIHCREGNALLWLNERNFLFRQGDWMLIKPGVRHRIDIHGDQPYTYLSVNFDLDDPELRIVLQGMTNPHYRYSQATNHGLLKSSVDQIETMMYTCLHEERSTYDSKNRLVQLTPMEKLQLQAYILQIVSIFITIQANESNKESTRDKEATHKELDIANEIAFILDSNVTGNPSIADIPV